MKGIDRISNCARSSLAERERKREGGGEREHACAVSHMLQGYEFATSCMHGLLTHAR